MKWYEIAIIAIGSIFFYCGAVYLCEKIGGWICSKIKARKEKRAMRKDELQITATADCSQAVREIERFRERFKWMRENPIKENNMAAGLPGTWTGEWTPTGTFNLKEKTMPTRQQIEDALHGKVGCKAKWTFLPKVCNGREDAHFYTDLWLAQKGVPQIHSGCAYCTLFKVGVLADCPAECPLVKMGQGCEDESSTYYKWHDNPTRENALAMLDKVKHSLDNYFDEELIDIEPCICGKTADNNNNPRQESHDHPVYVGSPFVHCFTGRGGCGKIGPAKDNTNDRIRAWNEMIRREREEKKDKVNPPRCKCGEVERLIKKEVIHSFGSLTSDGEWWGIPLGRGSLKYCPRCGEQL